MKKIILSISILIPVIAFCAVRSTEDTSSRFQGGVNNVNACRPSDYPPDDPSNSSRADKNRVNLCKTFSKDISTRQNGVHVNQPHQVPSNLANRGQNTEGSCDSPPAPRSKKPRNTPEGRTSVSDRYDGILEKEVYEADQKRSSLAEAGGASRYGDNSYTASFISLERYDKERSDRESKKRQRTKEYENSQNYYNRANHSQEEEFKANKLKNCQVVELRGHLEDLSRKPKVDS